MSPSVKSCLTTTTTAGLQRQLVLCKIISSQKWVKGKKEKKIKVNKTERDASILSIQMTHNTKQTHLV